MVDLLKPDKKFEDLSKNELKDQYRAWYAEMDKVGGKTSPEGREIFQQMTNWAGAVSYNINTIGAFVEVNEEREKAATKIQAVARGHAGRKQAAEVREGADRAAVEALATAEAKKPIPKSVMNAALEIGSQLRGMLGGTAGGAGGGEKDKKGGIKRS